MAQPTPVPDLFYDADGYFRSPVDAAAYAIIASGGQGFTTPAREARRMLTSPDPRYKAIARNWLAANGLPEVGDLEPADWQDWYSTWVAAHSPLDVGRAVANLAPVPNSQTSQPPRPDLHVVPPAPPAKVTVQVPPGSRLESLLGQQPTVKARLDEAEKQMRTIKDSITAELTTMYPGTGAFDIPSAPGRPPLILRHTAPNYFDTKRFKAERPDLYPQYLKPSPRWTLGVPQKKDSQ